MNPAIAQPALQSRRMAWLLAIRPKTLSAAFAPVAVGTALAHREGGARLLPALAALMGALLIQIGTNFLNDYYDFKNGADTAERLGPTRVTQAGLLAPQAVRSAGFLCFAAAFVLGCYLVAQGGWAIVAIGLSSLLSGYAYTGGPYPLGYRGWGDVFVFLFFGFAAVAGTYCVQTGRLSPLSLLVSLPVGALATAILAVNNLRDASTDAKAGKRTLVVRLGRKGGQWEYGLLLLLAFATPAALVVFAGFRPLALLPLASLPLAIAPLKRVWTQSGKALNPALGETARLQMAFSVLYALGISL